LFVHRIFTLSGFQLRFYHLYFTHIVASSTVSDYVTNLVTHIIFCVANLCSTLFYARLLLR